MKEGQHKASLQSDGQEGQMEGVRQQKHKHNNLLIWGSGSIYQQIHLSRLTSSIDCRADTGWAQAACECNPVGSDEPVWDAGTCDKNRHPLLRQFVEWGEGRMRCTSRKSGRAEWCECSRQPAIRCCVRRESRQRRGGDGTRRQPCQHKHVAN